MHGFGFRPYGRTVVGLLSVSILLSACSRSEPNEADQISWTIEDTAVVTIGAESDGPTSDLFGVAGAFLTDDGRLVFGDSSERIFVFDTSGTYLNSFGGTGEGPGEIGRMGWLQLAGPDTLFVHDALSQRVHLFLLSGEFMTSVESPLPDYLVGRLSDGTWVARRDLPQAEFRGPYGVLRGETALLRYRDVEFGGPPDTLGLFPGTETLVIPGGIFRGEFLRRVLTRVTADALLLTTGDRLEVIHIQRNGLQADTFGVDGVPELVPYEQLAGSEMANVAGGFPRDLPPIYSTMVGGLLVDTEGLVWLGRYQDEPGTSSPWYVFDRSGTMIQVVQMPPRFRPLYIASQKIVGVSADAFEVERLEIRRVHRR